MKHRKAFGAAAQGWATDPSNPQAEKAVGSARKYSNEGHEMRPGLTSVCEATDESSEVAFEETNQQSALDEERHEEIFDEGDFNEDFEASEILSIFDKPDDALCVDPAFFM